MSVPISTTNLNYVNNCFINNYFPGTQMSLNVKSLSYLSREKEINTKVSFGMNMILYIKNI